MQVRVTKDEVIITDSEYQVHKGEYRANEVEYELSDEYEGLTCKAIFNDGRNAIEVPITTGTSIIPYEILSSGASKCELRVYGYVTEEVEGETKLKLRYSPTYTEFDIRRGSYIPDTSNSEEITPSQFEQYCEALNQGLEDISEGLEEINTAVTEANNLNIDVNKVDKVATITLTKKDATTKEVTIRDGYDLEYDWNGTELGIKRDDEQDYEYVDLKGEKGDCDFATFEIQNGHLIMNKPDDLTQVDFSINPNTGHLEVEVMV